jgi:hypothetical protein
MNTGAKYDIFAANSAGFMLKAASQKKPARRFDQ